MSSRGDDELVARVLVVAAVAERRRSTKSMTTCSSPQSSRTGWFDPGADHVGLLEERVPPRLELGQEVDPRTGSSAPARRR